MSRLAALTVILLAGALATAWAFLVPVFQAPDEPAHFDYAISIYQAGRLIRLTDGKPDWIVSPYTKYLMRATDFDRIVAHSSMRVPPGYGSRPYFARVDEEAPQLQPPPSISGRISYVTALYPFGFYALEALWMGLVAHLTASLTTVFFAARLLCVALMMTALYFNYRTARNLGIPPVTSLLLIAAIGFFPLTSLVSSYVQPDNLAYALLSAALFFATDLRARSPRLAPLVALGICLGLLALTKYHLFLAAAIPIVPFVYVRYLRSDASLALRAAAVAALGIPVLLALAAQQSFVLRSAAGMAHPTMISANALHVAAAAGLAPAFHYVAVTSVAAFVDFFVYGGCAATFWQTIGWVDTPLVIGTPALESWIRAAIALATVAAAAVLAFHFSRTALRLGAAAKRGHARAAAAILFGDPVLNSYLCFFALMMALYVVSDNAYGAEGRQWYPFIFAAFLCFAWYAPRALSKRHRATSAILAGVLAAYSATAAAYALGDLRARYYGPQLARYIAVDPAPAQIGASNFGMLWPPANAAYHVSDGIVAFAFPRGSQLTVVGAAISPQTHEVAREVAVSLDGHTTLPVLAHQYAFMIAEATHSVTDGYSAFYANINTGALREGAHTVAAYARTGAGQRFAHVGPTRIFFVTDRAGRFSTATLHRYANAPAANGTIRIAGSCGGGAALVEGSFAGKRDAAVWLLVGDRPFPARYRAEDSSFVATIPTADLLPAAYVVTAYALRDGGLPLRLANTTTLRFVGKSGPQFLPHPPSACADPLAELESR